MNYPGGIRPKTASEGNPLARKNRKGAKIAAGNRGMDFEEDINSSNLYYRDKGLCLITKRKGNSSDRPDMFKIFKHPQYIVFIRI